MPEVSIREVAKLAGVSIATVSRCINNPEKVTENTRLKVHEAIAETGYSPNTLAQSFRRGRTNLVTVVVPSVGDPFLAEVMNGLRSTAKANGYSVVIEDTRHNTMTAGEIRAMLMSRQTDGIILLATMSPFGAEIISANSRRRVPIVVGCEKASSEHADLPGVHVDNVAAARDATTYLISQGHERIGMIYAQDSSQMRRDRQLGYRAAMKSAKLPVRDGWVADGMLSIAGARQATRELLDVPQPPTAIFCATDEMAMGCLHEVKAAGLAVPGDISVMGFDDIPYAAVTDPPLTTIRQPAKEIGERVMSRLCRRIEEGRGDGNSDSQVLPHKLILRQSVGRPPELGKALSRPSDYPAAR